MAKSDCRLYLITPSRLEPHAFAETLKRALSGGDVASLQLRLKDVSDDEIMRAGDVLIPIAQRAFAHRSRMNGLAAQGRWSEDLERSEKAA